MSLLSSLRARSLRSLDRPEQVRPPLQTIITPAAVSPWLTIHNSSLHRQKHDPPDPRPPSSQRWLPFPVQDGGFTPLQRRACDQGHQELDRLRRAGRRPPSQRPDCQGDVALRCSVALAKFDVAEEQVVRITSHLSPLDSRLTSSFFWGRRARAEE